MKKSINAISVKDLKKSFGKVNVLDGISFDVRRGTVLALLGPNGAGKTTTVKVLSTLIEADGGSATVEGFDVHDDGDDVRSIIGLTGQYAAIDEYLSGRENLQMLGRLYHLSKQDANTRTEQLLEQFDLLDAADRPSKTYSGGMSRRLDLAASLIAAPPVIFLDEPTTGLDPRSRLAMWDIIKKLVKGGSTILLTTQYLEEADILADKIAVIDGGKVIANGTADELKAKVGKERIELVFATDKGMNQASELLKNHKPVITSKKHTISIPNDSGVKRLRTILEILEKNNVHVEGLSLHKPTLDDVFMNLTGHKAAMAEEEEA